jgi:hypothetical protein
MLKQFRFFAPAVLVLILIARALSLWAQHTAPKGFTATKITRFVSFEGRPGSTHSQLYASRADGGYVVETYDEAGSLRRVTFPDKMIRYLVDPKLRLRSTFKLANQDMIDRMTHRKYSGDNCSAYVPSDAAYVGTGSVFGISTAVYHWEFNAVENIYQHSAEFAPSLNCFKLKGEDIWVGKDGKRTSATIEEITSLRIGEPDPNLFIVPDTFQEVEPSYLQEHHLLSEKVKADAIPRCLRNAWARLDRAYAAGGAGRLPKFTPGD